jgi:hypothetical protein
MKIALASLALLMTSSSSFASCGVETAKKYVLGLESVAAELSGGKIISGDKANGRTLTKSDISAISADSAYLVSVSNTYDYSNYLVTLKQEGRACFPASIVMIGNSRTNAATGR